MYNLRNKDEINICKKDLCVNAKGENAKLISVGIFTMLILAGISTLIKN